MKCIICGFESHVYVEVKGIGASFCKEHSKSIGAEDVEKIIALNKNTILEECDNWLKSRPEKYV